MFRNLDRRIIAAVGLVVIGGLLAAGLLFRQGFHVADPRLALTVTPAEVRVRPVPTPTVRPAPTPTATAQQRQLAQPVSTASDRQLPPVTPPPGGQVVVITPAREAVGWASNQDRGPNQFGDYNIYAGSYEGRTYVGAMQFDLSAIPLGAPVTYADLWLTGLLDKYEGGGGTWSVELLASWVDEEFATRSYKDFTAAGAGAVLIGTLFPADRAVGRANQFVFASGALAELAARSLLGRVSLRIAGPADGNNLFSWDSGYGSNSRGAGPVLRVAVGPAPLVPPATPTRVLVVITLPPPTPTPENVLTAAARIVQVRAQGAPQTPTPFPANWVTPVVIVPTATPANAATAEWLAAIVTAEAIVRGTATPLPPNVWTATPSPTYFIITPTPQPASYAQAIAQAVAEATRRAAEGTATPLPPNMVTATPRFVVITSVPTPQNVLTAEVIRAEATIHALQVGTGTPEPQNWVIATPPPPLPLVIPLRDLTPTPLPTAGAAAPGSETGGGLAIPASLQGRILFVSNRFGQPGLFVMDADGGNVALLTRSYPYDLARAREPYAADGARYLLVKPDNRDILQIFMVDPRYNVTRGVTTMSAWAYDPVWSPVGDRLAFVSSEPGNDEIYTVNLDSSGLQRLTKNRWEWDKHPSWSPDGTRIVFFSNRDTARRQIWVMNADGSNQYNLSNNETEDWDPVWVK